MPDAPDLLSIAPATSPHPLGRSSPLAPSRRRPQARAPKTPRPRSSRGDGASGVHRDGAKPFRPRKLRGNAIVGNELRRSGLGGPLAHRPRPGSEPILERPRKAGDASIRASFPPRSRHNPRCAAPSEPISLGERRAQVIFRLPFVCPGVPRAVGAPTASRPLRLGSKRPPASGVAEIRTRVSQDAGPCRCAARSEPISPPRRFPILLRGIRLPAIARAPRSAHRPNSGPRRGRARATSLSLGFSGSSRAPHSSGLRYRPHPPCPGRPTQRSTEDG